MGYDVVILAAGQGKRMDAGKNKMLLDLLGMPIIVHTLLVFERDHQCGRIVLVFNENEWEQISGWIADYEITKVMAHVQGGKERQDSVYEGLKALKDIGSDDIVLIHDGARPVIEQVDIHKVAEAAERSGAAILAVPVKDTIKQVQNNEVQKTIDRSSLWMVQTPQAFRLSVIMRAHETARQKQLAVTDDASMIESQGGKVTVVRGNYRNIKLTTPEDLFIAEQFMKDKGGNKQ
jgi:2-C-methyl-D-erythritol 4-phosphate cytidylyltransferase